MTIEKVEKGGQKYLRFARRMLARLTDARNRIGLDVMSKAYKVSGSLIFLKSRKWGQDLIYITGAKGLETAYAYGIGDACACDGDQVDDFQFVMDTVATETDPDTGVVTHTVAGRARAVQRYNNVVTFEGSWQDVSYSLALDLTSTPQEEGPPLEVFVVTETFVDWPDGSAFRSGTYEVYPSGTDLTTTKTLVEMFGAYPGALPSTCSLVAPSYGIRRLSFNKKDVQNGPNYPFDNSEHRERTDPAQYVGVTYSPLTGYSYTDLGVGTPSTVVVDSFPPFDDGFWTQAEEDTYVWGAGYVSVNDAGVNPNDPAVAATLADWVVYDAEYPLWLAREAQRLEDCDAAVATRLTAMNEDLLTGVYHAMRSTAFLDGYVCHPNVYSNVGATAPVLGDPDITIYTVEYDYDTGTPGTGYVIPGGATILKARVKTGVRTKLYRGTSPESTPVTGVHAKFVGTEIAVSSYVGNLVVLLDDSSDITTPGVPGTVSTAPLGTSQRVAFLARYEGVDRDVSLMDDKDKVMSLFITKLPEPEPVI